MRACLRDESESFVAAFSCLDSSMYAAAKAEAWELYKGLEWIALLGYNKVVFELDCKMSFLLCVKRMVAPMLSQGQPYLTIAHYF
ncbi:hypothetical protein L195_g025457 [Trifolium pratense]|uniref:RNase H type-1 domain-containing protein n=1 Tax=Trifolium pratense TaxID=57577 RepID=A0A2K3NGJ3_TRIPR|nr:hypothetical protein L195_g025457 [Trifolium pratense]